MTGLHIAEESYCLPWAARGREGRIRRTRVDRVSGGRPRARGDAPALCKKVLQGAVGPFLAAVSSGL